MELGNRIGLAAIVFMISWSWAVYYLIKLNNEIHQPLIGWNIQKLNKHGGKNGTAMDNRKD